METLTINKRVLRQFTEELIRNSNRELIKQTKRYLEEQIPKDKIRERRVLFVPQQKPLIRTSTKPLIEINSIKEPPRSGETYLPSISNEDQTPVRMSNQGVIELNKTIPQNTPNRRLFIPEPKLPPQLAYLKPTPAFNVELDLGPLNQFLKDPSIRSIECNGPDIGIVVKTQNQERVTNVLLNQDEINQVINIFSTQTKIPIEEGVFRVALGNLAFSAIISDIVGSKFIIKKLILGTQQNQFMRR